MAGIVSCTGLVVRKSMYTLVCQRHKQCCCPSGPFILPPQASVGKPLSHRETCTSQQEREVNMEECLQVLQAAAPSRHRNQGLNTPHPQGLEPLISQSLWTGRPLEEGLHCSERRVRALVGSVWMLGLYHPHWGLKCGGGGVVDSLATTGFLPLRCWKPSQSSRRVKMQPGFCLLHPGLGGPWVRSVVADRSSLWTVL